MFRDKYTDFYFCDKSSADFKVWITNNHDLQFNSAPSFSDTFTAPVFAQSRYHENTKIEKQDFKLKLAAINITKQEWRAINEWLSPQQIGALSFGWNKNHYYNVKVTSAPAGTIWIKNSVDHVLEELYIVTFEITFSTTEDWAALGAIASIPINTIDSVNLGDTWDAASMAHNAAERYKNDYYIPFFASLVPFEYRDSVYNLYVYSNIGNVTITDGYIYFPSEQGVLKIQSGSKPMLIYKQIKNSYKQNENPLVTVWEKQITPEGYSAFIGTNCFLFSETQLKNVTSTHNYIVSNPSTFQSTINVTTNAYPFSLNLNNQILSIDLMDSQLTITNPVYYNGKSGSCTYQGEIAQNVRNIGGMPIFKDVLNDKLTIESGRPETIKVIFESCEPYDMPIQYESNNQTTTFIKNVFQKAVFRCSKKTIYDRYKNFVMTIFQSTPDQSNRFNEDAYNTKQYYESVFENKTLINPNFYFEEKNGYLYLNVIFANNFCYKKNGSYGSDQLILNKNNYVFISLCDVDVIDINQEENGFTILDFQTRDVL